MNLFDGRVRCSLGGAIVRTSPRLLAAILPESQKSSCELFLLPRVRTHGCEQSFLWDYNRLKTGDPRPLINEENLISWLRAGRGRSKLDFHIEDNHPVGSFGTGPAPGWRNSGSRVGTSRGE